MLGIVCRRYRDFEAAEDAVQEALLAAAMQWPEQGVPENPRAWLVHVAGHRMKDQLRAEIARRKRETKHLTEVPDDEQVVPSPDEAVVETDDTLLLLFMCCHPSLTRTSAIALTLRAVGGLTTAEIAHAFLVPEATMAQRISRAKQLIKKSGVELRMPTAAERDERLEAVLHVLYLIFNEGYASSEGPALARVDLSSEAIRLARAVHQLLPSHGEVAGLLALMLLTDARREARTGASGELVPLDEQDRSRWSRPMIEEGVALVSATLAASPPGPYSLQAAIAALHDEAKTASETDWPQILALYDVLGQLTDNPVVTLNRAIAASMVHGPAHALELLAPLANDPRLANHHRLAAVRGHLHEKLGARELARADFARAAELTASLPERSYLRLKAARLGSIEESESSPKASRPTGER